MDGWMDGRMDGWTDGRIHMTNLIVAFRSFVNALKNFPEYNFVEGRSLRLYIPNAYRESLTQPCMYKELVTVPL
jgi:hypothetical protein